VLAPDRVELPRQGGPARLLASWRQLWASKDETALLEDAAHPLTRRGRASQ